MVEDNISEIHEDELTSLKSRADVMGVKYHPNIGVDKLKAKIIAYTSSEGVTEYSDPVVASDQNITNTSATESLGQQRTRLKKEASELIRVQVTCMNPNKASWKGEIFEAGNGVVGTFKKYLPYNEPWHVPRIIFNMIRDKECQIFYSHKDAAGNKTDKGRQIKEFALNVLAPLSPEEMHALAQRQAMARGTVHAA